MKKFFLIICIILIIVMSIGWNIYSNKKHIIINHDVNNLQEYKFSYNEISKIDKLLTKQKYTYSSNIKDKVISIFILGDNMVIGKEYLISKDSLIDINVPKDKKIIISFPYNKTINYSWNIRNEIDNKILNFNNISKLQLPITNEEKDGVNYMRQNFLFHTVNKGLQKLIFRYQHNTGDNDEYFEISLNIMVE